jgi:hypothetical protein
LLRRYRHSLNPAPCHPWTRPIKVGLPVVEDVLVRRIEMGWEPRKAITINGTELPGEFVIVDREFRPALHPGLAAR